MLPLLLRVLINIRMGTDLSTRHLMELLLLRQTLYFITILADKGIEPQGITILYVIL